MHPDFTLRIARVDEIPALNELIKDSAQSLSLGYYTQVEIDALNQYVFSVDTALVSDQTYFVIEKNGEYAACGGFSKRKKLFGGDQYTEATEEFLDPSKDPAKIRAFFVHSKYARQGLASAMLKHCEQKAMEAGFTSLELMATLPGVPFYKSQGFEGEGAYILTLDNGVNVRLVQMQKKNLKLVKDSSMKRSNSGSSWREVKHKKDTGLQKNQTFPEVIVYDPSNKSNTLLSNLYSKNKKTIIVRQPGFTPPDGYWGEKHDKAKWVSNPGAAGCGAQTDGWSKAYKKFQDAGYEVILLTSEKTSDEWVEMLKAKSLPFRAVSLTGKAVEELNNLEKDLGFKNPSFKFEDKIILPRAYWTVESEGEILDFKDKSDLKAEQCEMDADNTLKQINSTSGLDLKSCT